MNKPFFKTKALWGKNESYSNHRIPGMIVTNRGTLIAYCEARQSESDWALMDIIMQRSTDHGETFSAPYILAKGMEEKPTVNNPVMIQDKNGRIHFFYCENYTIMGGRALRRYSDDDGVTWSEAIDVTESTNPDFHNAFAFGPGHGTLSESGAIIIPIWMVPKSYNAPLTSHAPSVVSTFYSYDGENWHLGEILESLSDITNPNETSSTLTSDGEIYFNIRFQGSCRAHAYSKSGHSDWTNYSQNPDLPDPQCYGSVTAYDDKEHPYTLLFTNCNSKSERTNVTVYASYDDGRTYPVSRLIDQSRGGYSEIAVDNSKKLIYLLYEENFGQTDHLAIFNYEWLTDTNNNSLKEAAVARVQSTLSNLSKIE